MPKKLDWSSYVGKRFGRLLVKKHTVVDGVHYFQCECACGNKTFVRAYNVLQGGTTSCGCSKRVAHSGLEFFTDDQLREMCKLRASGMSYGRIAKRIGGSRSTIAKYCALYASTINQLKDEYMYGSDSNS